MGVVAGPYSGYSLHGPGGIQVVAPELGTVLGRATLLSPTAVWAAPGSAASALARERRLRVSLDAGGTSIGPLVGEPRWSDAGALGIQLVDVPLEQGRRILSLLDDEVLRGGAEPEASPLPVQEEVTGSERIESILTVISAMSNRGVLRRPGRTVRVIQQCSSPRQPARARPRGARRGGRGRGAQSPSAHPRRPSTSTQR